MDFSPHGQFHKLFRIIIYDSRASLLTGNLQMLAKTFIKVPIVDRVAILEGVVRFGLPSEIFFSVGR